MPEDPEPRLTITTRPLPATSTMAGEAASARLRPAPAPLIPAALRVSSVSRNPPKPQSRTWLVAREQQWMPAAVTQGTLRGCMR
jgi:hypothetical protein